MPLLGFLLGEAIERRKEAAAKRKLEQKLGRQVSTQELYSLGTYMEEKEIKEGTAHAYSSSTPALSDASPRSIWRPVLIWWGASAVIAVLVVGLYIFNMPQARFNKINPFAPSPPAGAFPAEVGRFKRYRTPDLHQWRKIGTGVNFEARYEADSKSWVQYSLWKFPTAAEAQQGMAARKKEIQGYVNEKFVDDTDSRFATVYLGDGRANAYWVDGANLVNITGRSQEIVYEFEGLLKKSPPAKVVEVELQPKQTTASSTGPQVTVGDLLNEYQKDYAAADKKYKGKTITVSGVVEVAQNDKRGNPMVGFMKPGSTRPADGMVICSFDKSQEASVSAIKKGDTVRLSGRVFGSLIGNVMLDKCSKL